MVTRVHMTAVQLQVAVADTPGFLVQMKGWGPTTVTQCAAQPATAAHVEAELQRPVSRFLACFKIRMLHAQPRSHCRPPPIPLRLPLRRSHCRATTADHIVNFRSAFNNPHPATGKQRRGWSIPTPQSRTESWELRAYELTRSYKARGDLTLSCWIARVVRTLRCGIGTSRSVQPSLPLWCTYSTRARIECCRCHHAVGMARPPLTRAGPSLELALWRLE